MQGLRFSRGVVIAIFILSINGHFSVSTAAGYDSTYVLAVTQKYAMPENVANGDYVGTWIKTWTFMTKATTSFSIEKNFNNAFTINSGSGLITIADYTKINGKIVRQDTTINLIIRSTNTDIGFELDTAKIQVKENAFCVFVDYKAVNGTGSRTSPKSSLVNSGFSIGKMYCIKRGSIISGVTTALHSLVSSAAHPLIICAYGAGNKPKFQNGTECFNLETSGATEVSARDEYLYFYDIWIRNYSSFAFKVRRLDDHIGWYNCDIYNCDKQDVESTLILNTSNYSDTTKRFDFELLNCRFDTTSLNVRLGSNFDGPSPGNGCTSCFVEPSFIKTGVGPVNIINCYFGHTPGMAVRQASGVSSKIKGSVMKHLLINKQWSDSPYNGGYSSAISIKQDNAIVEDCRITGGFSQGIVLTSAGGLTEMPPDNATIRNVYMKGIGMYGIWLADNGTGYKAFHNTIIEDNYLVNVATGIRENKGINTIIRRNKIISGSANGIKTATSSSGMGIYCNIIYGYTGDEIAISVGSGTKIYNNTIDGEINYSGALNTTLKNNLFKTITGTATLSNNLDIDVLTTTTSFANYTGHDYCLLKTATSIIDKGIDAGIACDYSGNQRIGLPDIGAYEYASAPVIIINNPPMIADQQFQVHEESFTNQLVGQISATEPDVNQSLTYSIISGNESGLFLINAQSGVLSTTTANVFGTNVQSYSFSVRVTDNGADPKSSSAVIAVNFLAKPVIIVNNPPMIADQQFQVHEESFTNQFVGQISATEPDVNQSLTYSIISGNESGLFLINAQSGALSTTTANVFGTNVQSYSLSVRVTDNGADPKNSSAMIAVNFLAKPVIIVNNPPAIFNQQFTIPQSTFSNLFVGNVIATESDANQQLTYSIVSGNESSLFILNSLTGELKTIKANVFRKRVVNYNLVIKVTDNGQTALSNSANVMVTFLTQSKMVYVDPVSLSSPLEDGSQAHPLSSWSDVSWIEGNTYLQKRGTVSVDENILVGANNVTIDAYGEGELPIIRSETNSYMLSGYNKANVKINNLHMISRHAQSCIYFLGDSCDNITIEHCLLENVSNAIRVVDGKTFNFKYNTIHSENEGIYATADVLNMYYNIFKNSKSAVNVMSSNSKAFIYNNVFINNGESVSDSYAELTLYNNIFYMPEQNQKAIRHGSNKITSDNNIFYPEQEGFIEISSKNYSRLDQLQQELNLDENSFTRDPRFMDIIRENFTIESESPAINSGRILNISEDYFGNKVPISGAPDIGICEFDGKLSGIQGNITLFPRLTVYPNPSVGNINIDFESDFESTAINPQGADNLSEIRVTDVNGKTIFAKVVETTNTLLHESLDLSSVSNGIYFVIFQSLQKTVTQKLILNR